MLYFDVSARKASVVSSVAIALVLSVSFTFYVKDQLFGGTHFSSAIGRTLGRTFMQGFYTLKFAAQGGGFAAGLAAVPQGSAKAHAEAQAIPVLLYHSIKTADDGESVSQSTFAAQMFALKRAGWQTITLEDLHAFMRGEKKLPERSFLLTFDDGAKDSYYPSDSVLAALSFNAVDFILPKFSLPGQSQYYLSKGEIDTMLASGRWEIGSHSQNSHEPQPIDAKGTLATPLANRLWLSQAGRLETMAEYKKRVTDDLRISQENLRNAFPGNAIDAFAFPFGEFGHLSQNYPGAETFIVDAVAKQYTLAFYQTWRGEGFSFNYPSEATPAVPFFLVKRIEPKPTTKAEELVAMLENGLPKQLPYTDSFDTDHGWFSTWGNYGGVVDHTLPMKPEVGASGNAVVLDGTGAWEDYTLTAKVTSQNRTGVTLWVRFRDNNDTAECNFSNGFIHVEQVVGGVTRVIQGTDSPSIVIPKGVFTVRAKVEGRKLTCTMGSVHAESDFLDESLKKGGVGIKAWDATPGKSIISISSVSVEPLSTKTKGLVISR